ncbi:MAG TPA: HEAT repeat domain-containing protein, partial [Polyangiaceae bacterium]
MRCAAYLIVLTLIACQSQKLDPRTHSAAPERSARPALFSRDGLLAAEQDRDSAAIGGEALSSRDVTVRRTAARALARIADARAIELLPLALADEDAQVISWAAYGLGYGCRGHEAKVVHALIARAASLSNARESALTHTPLLGPIEAI